MFNQMDYLSLPDYLNKIGVINKVKTLCIVNKEIPLPNHLNGIDRLDSNKSVLVDLIAVQLPNETEYKLVRGTAVAILGYSTISKLKDGKVVLLVESTVRRSTEHKNYIALTTIFNKQYTQEPYLYATKVLLRDKNAIENSLPQLSTLLNSLSAENWDIDKVLKSNPEPSGYIRSCEGVDFGTSKENSTATSTNIPESVQKSPQVSVVKEAILNPKEKVGRGEIRNKSGYLADLEDKIAESKGKVKSLVSLLEGLEIDMDTNINDAIKYASKNIDTYYRRTKGKDIKTGQNIIKNVLEAMYPEYREKRKAGVSEIDKSLSSAIFPIYKIWGDGKYVGPTSKFYEQILIDRELIYIGLIDEIMGMRGRLISSYEYAKKLSIDVFNVMVNNPYYLTILDNRIPIEDLDKLSMLYNVDMTDKEVLRFRNAAYLHNILLDTNNPLIGSSTIVGKNIIKNSFQNGFLVSNKTYETIKVRGNFLNTHEFNNLKTYVNNNIEEKQFDITTKGWLQANVKGSKKWVLPIDGGNKDKAIQDYLDSGLGLEIEIDGVTYLSDFHYASKEEYFINKIYTLMATGYRPTISPDSIEQCIRDFERLKSIELDIPNFRLEERQKDSVRLLYNPVMCVTGPAGSGKTTAAEALVYALQNLMGIDENEIMFCAPTGKAANRLKEVVKKPTRTIHSLFLIGGENFTLIDEEDIKQKDDIKVLIIDESSMITLELMYTLLTKISNGARVIMLGDIEQLPPIGPGKPFATMLNFAPCVVLNVSKRASDNSGITRNAKTIIYNSDSRDMKMLEQADDFRIMNEKQENIVKLVKGICNYHLGNSGKDLVVPNAIKSLGTDLTPDDIQIISPVNDYNWGVKNLNKELQYTFNPNDGLAIRYKKGLTRKKGYDGKAENEDWYVEFKVGDRVIHLENKNKAIRLEKVGKSSFQAVDKSLGIMNGDVGKIEGIYRYEDIEFIDTDVNISEELEGNDSTLYISVAYKDINPDGSILDFIIIYKCDMLNDNDKLKKVIEVSSYDLAKLDLANALTVHKLQGSQAKLVICVFYKAGYSGFISRNMIYTATTRAEKGVYLLGDVIGYSSAISEGRKVEQTSQRTTLTDKMY